MPCSLKIHSSSGFHPHIRVLPSHPRFTLISAIYPLVRVLSSYPRFTLSSAFYPPICVLPSYPCFTLISVFHPSRPYVHPSVHPSVRILHFHPYPRFILTRKKIESRELKSRESRIKKTRVESKCRESTNVIRNSKVNIYLINVIYTATENNFTIPVLLYAQKTIT